MKFSIEIKWAIYFTLMTLAWMLLEKLCGLHGKYIDYHLYLTNLFAIPAIWFLDFISESLARLEERRAHLNFCKNNH